MIGLAPAARASSRYMSSIGSRQSGSRNGRVEPDRRIARDMKKAAPPPACERPRKVAAVQDVGDFRKSGRGKRKNIIFLGPSRARSGTLSALRAALTVVDASKTITPRCRGRVVRRSASISASLRPAARSSAFMPEMRERARLARRTGGGCGWPARRWLGSCGHRRAPALRPILPGSSHRPSCPSLCPTRRLCQLAGPRRCSEGCTARTRPN